MKETNNAAQTGKKNIQNQTSTLRQLENNIAGIEEFVEEYDACEQSLAVVPETGGDLPPYAPETGGDLPPPTTDAQNNTTIPSTTPSTTPPATMPTSPNTNTNVTDTPIVSLPPSPTPNNGAAALTMEVNTPTKMDVTWMASNNGVSGFNSLFSNNQTLLGGTINNGKLSFDESKAYLSYSSTSIEFDILAANNNLKLTQDTLKKAEKELKSTENKLKIEKKEAQNSKTKATINSLEKEIKKLKESTNTLTASLQPGAALKSWLASLIRIKSQVLSQPKLVATNTPTAHSVAQSGNA